ncbi:MAG: lipid biosynthesis B12-binding/radical SAM protein [Thermodesulfobacteriota bacterium]|jgi:lipid biosynthesis B12-binding/radical SAM protein
MSRVFLLSSNTMTEPYPVYPLGMAIVASALVSAGHHVRQFDLLNEDRSYACLHRTIQEFNPDFVGISMRNIDSVNSFTSEESWTLASDRAVIKKIKEATGAPVVLGGSAFSIMPEEILEYVEADYGIVGDGGILFNDWIEQVKQGLTPPRILRKVNSLETGDIPIRPLWNETILNHYDEIGGIIGLLTKRGCPHHCAYCTYPTLEGTRFRYREPGSVIEDIRQLQKDYRIETIFFTDAVFNDIQGQYLKLVEELLRQEIRIRWSAFFQPKGIEAKQFRLLKRSGLYAVEAGTDAACDTTLKGLNKSFGFDEVLRFNEACLEEEIPCGHYLMFGGPGENEDTVQEGLRNIELLKNCVVLAFSGVRIFPGTLLHHRAVSDGIVQESDSLLRPVFYFSPDIAFEALNETLEKAFKHQRQRLFPPLLSQEKIKVLRRFGYRGPLWDTLVSFNKPGLRK